MARPIVKAKAEASSIKQKQGRPAKNISTSKRAKKNSNLDFYLVFSLVLIASKVFSVTCP